MVGGFGPESWDHTSPRKWKLWRLRLERYWETEEVELLLRAPSSPQPPQPEPAGPFPALPRPLVGSFPVAGRGGRKAVEEPMGRSRLPHS